MKYPSPTTRHTPRRSGDRTLAAIESGSERMSDMWSRLTIRGSETRLVVVCLVAAMLIVASPTVARAADVSVSGQISGDTTWADGNTYHLTGRVQVAYGARLSIQPGAHIEGHGQALEVFGSVEAVGTAARPIVMRDLHLKGVGISALPSLLETFTVTVCACRHRWGEPSGRWRVDVRFVVAD